MPDYDVVVIGAGLGGLSAGAQLAKTGRSVAVLEQSDLIGGCSTFTREGFPFDLGASIIKVSDKIDFAFRGLGTSLATEVELVLVDPAYCVILKNDERLTLPVDTERIAAAIAQMAPGDEPGWRAYYSYMSRFLEVAFAAGFFRSYQGVLDRDQHHRVSAVDLIDKFEG